MSNDLATYLRSEGGASVALHTCCGGCGCPLTMVEHQAARRKRRTFAVYDGRGGAAIDDGRCPACRRLFRAERLAEVAEHAREGGS